MTISELWIPACTGKITEREFFIFRLALPGRTLVPCLTFERTLHPCPRGCAAISHAPDTPLINLPCSVFPTLPPTPLNTSYPSRADKGINYFDIFTIIFSAGCCSTLPSQIFYIYKCTLLLNVNIWISVASRILNQFGYQRAASRVENAE